MLDVVFERNGLQVWFYLTTLQLWSVRSSLTAAHEDSTSIVDSPPPRLYSFSHCSCLPLPVSSMQTLFKRNKVGSPRVQLTGMVAWALDSLELDLRSIVQVECMAERKRRVSTTFQEVSKSFFLWLRVLVTIYRQASRKCMLSTKLVLSMLSLFVNGVVFWFYSICLVLIFANCIMLWLPNCTMYVGIGFTADSNIVW